MYDLPEAPTAIACPVDYLLEKDRFMFSPTGNKVRLSRLRKATRPVITNLTELNAENHKSIPGATNSPGNMGKVLRGQKNAWDSQFSIS